MTWSPSTLAPVVAKSFSNAPAFENVDEADDAHTWLPQSFDTLPPRPAVQSPADSADDPFAEREAQQRIAFQSMLAHLNDGGVTVEDAEQLLVDNHLGSFRSVGRESPPHFGASHPKCGRSTPNEVGLPASSLP